MLNNIAFSYLIFIPSGIKIFYQGQQLNDAWLENTNKYLPNIIDLEINQVEKSIFIDLKSIIQQHQFNNLYNTLKLSLSTGFTRLTYTASTDLQRVLSNLSSVGINCFFDENSNLVFQITASSYQDERKSKQQTLNCYPIVKKNNCFPLVYKCPPYKVIVIGSCFSRSIFKSSSYFNPSYKNFFNIVYTSFHNSFISMMSQPINDNYHQYDDLTMPEIQSYVAMEFEKNIIELIDQFQPDLIIIDHYIEATAPIIKLNNNVLLTYNKYFAESIFKSKFSGCDVIYPGSEKHIQLLESAFTNFALQLTQLNLPTNIILLGSRLSNTKININTREISPWLDKKDWIQSSNTYWDKADQLFLAVVHDTFYLDMRSTNWLSDIESPIIGGASPSHYQSEYYKEIFKLLLDFTVNKI